ncbi:MAG: type II secretion system protein [Patescibacteria group bacterium]
MKKGFTLIEILIVVAIISVLSSVVLIGLGPAQRVGRDARRIADLRQMQSGLALYFNKCGYYPGVAQSDPPPCDNFVVISTWTELVGALRGSNIGVNQVSSDPSSAAGRNYLYGVSSDGSGYVLGASLEDPNNQALVNDADSLINGIDCEDPIYCIEF